MKRTTKKLMLKSETIVALQRGQLDQVVGGGSGAACLSLGGTLSGGGGTLSVVKTVACPIEGGGATRGTQCNC